MIHSLSDVVFTDVMITIVLHFIDFNRYNYTSHKRPREVEDDIVARGQKQNDDLLMEDELAAAFLNDDDQGAPQDDQTTVVQEENWEEEVLPGQLALDVYETAEHLVVKARTAGVNKQDLDVSISDGMLTISGTLSSGDDTEVTQWHYQECYWGEFSRTITVPVQVKEEEVEAILKDGVLTIRFTKVKQEQARKIQIQ